MAQTLNDDASPNPVYYHVELSTLYRERLDLYPAIFDDDNFIHGHTANAVLSALTIRVETLVSHVF